MSFFKTKKFIIFSVCSILLLLIIFTIYRSYSLTYNSKFTRDEQVARLIEKAITLYINDSRDTMLENLNFESGDKLTVISRKTRWSELVIAMRKVIKDKNDPSKTYGPMIEVNGKTADYTDLIPTDTKYKGYKIDIYVKKNKVTVVPYKKETGCVVTIHSS